jgi:hypothetical protein
MTTKTKPCFEQHVPREVIKHRLLAALDDKDKVALITSEADLEMLIAALGQYESTASRYMDKARAFRLDLIQLHQAAYGTRS